MTAPAAPAWQPLEGGSWLFNGRAFQDARGSSDEILDVPSRPVDVPPFPIAQENLVFTADAGCARGLHYQVPPFGQAKLVTIVRGQAQLFWLPLEEPGARPRVHSIVLSAGAQTLYTPYGCAHGLLTLEPGTAFLLKMSAPVSLGHRGEASLLDPGLEIAFAGRVRPDLLSERDRSAPLWAERRRS